TARGQPWLSGSTMPACLAAGASWAASSWAASSRPASVDEGGVDVDDVLEPGEQAAKININRKGRINTAGRRRRPRPPVGSLVHASSTFITSVILLKWTPGCGAAPWPAARGRREPPGRQ